MDAEMEIDAPPAGQGPAVPVPVSAADAGDDTEDEDAEDETGNAGKDEMDVEPQKPQPRCVPRVFWEVVGRGVCNLRPPPGVRCPCRSACAKLLRKHS